MGSGKIKIFVFGEDKVNWSIDKDKKAVTYFLKLNNFQITNNILKGTHIFCVWYDLILRIRFFWIRFLKRIFNKKIITVITNDITFYPEKIKKLKEMVDIFIVPSNKLFQYFKNQNLKVYRIPFFVNSEIFKPLNLSKRQICKKLNFDWDVFKDKFIIGSFQRDSLGRDLTKPKWQKNPDLLIEILENLLHENFVLLLAGPRRHYVISKCREKEIPYFFHGDYSYINDKKDDILVNNLSPEIINYLYNLTDICITTSKSEGGPKQILESALTRTLIFSTKVGLAPDILHPYLLFEKDEIRSLIEKIQKFFESPETFNKYVEYNFQKAKKEMDFNILKEKYRKVIFENLKI